MNPILHSETRRGFTLVELLVSTAIIALLLLILVSITGQTSATWRYTTGKMEQFREARNGFETITTRLSQATLNTYFDYFDKSGQQRTPSNAASFQPKKYGRASELRFVSGSANDASPPLLGNANSAKRVTQCVFFHAPLGVVAAPAGSANYKGFDNVLNAWGYFVELKDDSLLRPTFLQGKPNPPPKFRFRLMEFMQPSQSLQTYKDVAKGSLSPYSWFNSPVNASSAPVHVLAENIVALIVRPQLSRQDIEDRKGKNSELAPKYLYDTTQSDSDPTLNPRNQLPPVVQLTMIAIDEQTAARLNLNGSSEDIFKLKGKFQNSVKYSDDLAAVEAQFSKMIPPVNYRVFSTSVPIRTAKWSREQNF